MYLSMTTNSLFFVVVQPAMLNNWLRIAGTQVTLLGESFGGCLALQCAVEAPQLVQRLVLVRSVPLEAVFGYLTSFMHTHKASANTICCSCSLVIIRDYYYTVIISMLLVCYYTL
jgi:pimeloyl-ACP methyl ester carboxylesterase